MVAEHTAKKARKETTHLNRSRASVLSASALVLVERSGAGLAKGPRSCCGAANELVLSERGDGGDAEAKVVLARFGVRVAVAVVGLEGHVADDADDDGNDEEGHQCDPVLAHRAGGL